MDLVARVPSTQGLEGGMYETGSLPSISLGTGRQAFQLEASGRNADRRRVCPSRSANALPQPSARPEGPEAQYLHSTGVPGNLGG